MKKFLLLMVSITLFLQCSSTQIKGKEDIPIDPGIDIIGITAGSGWEYYSYGLYLKNRVMENPQSSLSTLYLKKAIDCFEKALAFNQDLDLVYFQLSECYYYLYDFSLSVEYANKAIEINKKDIKPYNRLYNIYMRLHNYEKAAEVLEDYLKADPDSVYVWYILAEHYSMNLKEMDKALSAYRNVISASQKTAVEDFYRENANYSMGYIYYKRDDNDNAAIYLNETLKINRNNLQALYLLAIIYMNKYDLDSAKKFSLLYLSKSPDNTKINAIMGRIEYLRNRPDAVNYLKKSKDSRSLDGFIAKGLYGEIIKSDTEAEKILQSAIKVNPKLISAHLALARIYTRGKNDNGAFNEYLTAGVLFYQNQLFNESAYALQEAALIKNDVPGIYYYLGRAHEDLNNFSLAVYNYKIAEKLKPNIDLLLHIGYLYGTRGEYEKAISYFSRAMDMEPGNSNPYFFRGLISIWQKDYAVAENNIKKAISLDEKNETYYFYLAIVMEKMEKYDEAIDSLEKAIKYNPQSARAFNFLGYLYADRDINIDESYSLINKALEIEPDNGAYIDSLGWVYYKKGKYQDALTKLLEAEKLLKKNESPDPVVYDHIGDTYNKLGSRDKALEYWKKSLEFEKNKSIQKKIEEFGK